MADKTKTKTRNPERKSGKAWGKGHTTMVKAKSTESLQRKAEKDARRAQRATVEHPGPNITMPKISFEWVGLSMAARWPGTHKRQSVDAILALEKRGGR